MSNNPNSTTSSTRQDNRVSRQPPDPSPINDRDFIETCYRHFNALAVTYKRQLDKIDKDKQ